MNQPAQNVQLTCPSCRQPYQIQVAYQASQHQCPLCGVMIGGQPAGLQAQQPMMATPASYPPGQYAGSAKPKKSNVVFIIRCVVGSLAAIAIVWTVFYLMNRNYNVTVDLGEASSSGQGGSINAGVFDVSPGKTFKATFRIKSKDGKKLYYEMRHADEEGGSITEGGVFVWKIPSDVASGPVSFNFSLKEKEGKRLLEIVKISFNVK